MPLEDTIRNYIIESFLPIERAESLGSDEDLLMILDSLQILRLVMDLEAKFSFKVDNSELTPEHLGTVARLASFVDSKRRESVC